MASKLLFPELIRHGTVKKNWLLQLPIIITFILYITFPINMYSFRGNAKSQQRIKLCLRLYCFVYVYTVDSE